MPIHIGKMIKAKAEERKLSQEALGRLINRSKQNVGDLYKRQSTDTEMLLALCAALDFDFFELYYAEEPLKSKRTQALAPLHQELQALRMQVSHKEERIRDLERAAGSDKKIIGLLEDELRYRRPS